MSYSLIILDRDGVINHDSPNYIRTPEQWQEIDGSCQAIASLSKSHLIAVATNQSGIGRGLYSEQTYLAIEQKMLTAVAQAGGRIDRIAYCPHAPEDNCRCRKPKPAMLLDICRDLKVLPQEAVMVGDSSRDLLAASVAGCASILVLTGNGVQTSKNYPLNGIKVFDNLANFAVSLIDQTP